MPLITVVPVDNDLRCDLLVAVVAPDLGELADPATLKPFSALLPREDADGDAPPYPVPATAVNQAVGHFACLSTKSVKYHSGNEKLKTVASQILGITDKLSARTVTVVLDGAHGLAAAAPIAEGILLGAYRFDKYKAKPEKKPVDPAIRLMVAASALKSARSAVARVQSTAGFVNLARDLVNEPPSNLPPEAIAAAARRVARATGIECAVLDEKALAKGGYTGTLTVGQGSMHKPRMIVLRHKPRRSALHLALVGKAVAFDTGGYCLKPPKDMWRMKGDMAGGAAVIAAVAAIAKLKVPIRVTGIVPAVVNAVDGAAMLPGDIITAKNGKTVHVDNTDAEGRLILMDGLIRAKEEGATHVVDIATLTGSIVNAIGTSMGGLFAGDQWLADQVATAGAEAGEQYWQMPMPEEYIEMIKCDFADLNNSTGSPRAGSITAALFLREFVHPSLKWVHLDIAGGFMAEKPWKYFGAGGTGIGVRTFVRLAERLSDPRQ